VSEGRGGRWEGEGREGEKERRRIRGGQRGRGREGRRKGDHISSKQSITPLNPNKTLKITENNLNQCFRRTGTSICVECSDEVCCHTGCKIRYFLPKGLNNALDIIMCCISFLF
jgi:hypothetical protein